jgi:Zn finger protein HypA/HybF involved in hydrogenase expression
MAFAIECKECTCKWGMSNDKFVRDFKAKNLTCPKCGSKRMTFEYY